MKAVYLKYGGKNLRLTPRRREARRCRNLTAACRNCKHCVLSQHNDGGRPLVRCDRGYWGQYAVGTVYYAAQYLTELNAQAIGQRGCFEADTTRPGWMYRLWLSWLAAPHLVEPAR